MGGIIGGGGALIFALLNLLALHQTGALRYEVESGHTKCITEEIKTDSMSVGKYSVVGLTSEDQRITVRVCVLISLYVFFILKEEELIVCS